MEDKTVFVEMFGESVPVRVLDFLMISCDFDFPIKHIAEEINAGWTSVEQAIKFFVEKGIVKETRTVGKSQRYALNKEDVRVKALMKFTLELAFAEAEKIAKQEEALVTA